MIKIKLDDSHVSVNDSCKTKKSILEKISDLLSRPSGVSKDDIFKKLVRSIGPVDRRLREDPVRMLRAIRISEKLGFELTTDVSETIRLDSGMRMKPR